MELRRLGPEHADAVLAFERGNRAWFARSISDRGDDWFEHFGERFQAALDGPDLLYVLVEQDGTVAGRFNLYEPAHGSATVGYRVAEAVAGRGVATTGLHELCELAAAEHGITTLRAVTSDDNVASQRVLAKNGFRAVGPTEVAGRPGTVFERP